MKHATAYVLDRRPASDDHFVFGEIARYCRLLPSRTKKMSLRFISTGRWNFLLAVVLALSAASAWADDKPGKPIVAVDRSYMDPSVSPCKDFYTYANGAFDKV